MTRLCGVIGDPIAHSLSPAMHNAAFEHLGLDFEYLKMQVRATELGAAIQEARTRGFVGINVTIPHKEAVLALCDPDELASEVGAVNTLVFEANRIRGTNTDVYGLTRALGDAPIDRAVVIGAGGAARAAVYVLELHGASVHVLARTARTLGEHEVIAFDDERTRALVSQADVVIDATPVGLGDAPVAWPLDELEDARVIDLVVRRSTPLLRAASARGLAVQNGAEMLLHQGARAFELFTGQPAPIDVMRRALEEALV